MPEQVTNADTALLLDSQLCFPLYACAREVVKRYRPFLDDIGLTYTQYIAMMVLWETPCISSKQLGRRLFLDSGTLTPVLKKLESMGYVNRKRDEKDERNLIVTLTGTGQALKERAAFVPGQMAACIRMEPQDAAGEGARLRLAVCDQKKRRTADGCGHSPDHALVELVVHGLEGLVHDQKLRFYGEGAGEGHALPHAAGKL